MSETHVVSNAAHVPARMACCGFSPINCIINTFKIFVVRVCVCVCVTDVGVAVTNLRFVCKTITCVSAFTKNGHNLS